MVVKERVAGGEKSEKGEKRTEGRGRRTEDSQQRAGKSGRRPEVGDQRSENRIADCGLRIADFKKSRKKKSHCGSGFLAAILRFKDLNDFNDLTNQLFD